jgi:hypothetical protein
MVTNGGGKGIASPYIAAIGRGKRYFGRDFGGIVRESRQNVDLQEFVLVRWMPDTLWWRYSCPDRDVAIPGTHHINQPRHPIPRASARGVRGEVR